MKINLTSTVADLKKAVYEEYETSIEVFTLKDNIAGENRKIKALCSKENITWPVEINATSVKELISIMKKKLGLSVSVIINTPTKKLTIKKNNPNNKKISIKISGRISKYFFGKLNKKIKSEAQKLIDNNSDKIADMQEFLSLFIALGMDNADMAIMDFKSRISDFTYMKKNCPTLFQIFSEIESDGINYISLYEMLFDCPENWEGGNAYMSFFEDDAIITVLVDGTTVINETLLKEFSQKVYEFEMSEDAKNENEKILGKWLSAFLKKNKKEFGLREEIGASVNSHGARFMELSFCPPALVKIASKEDAVIIDHDDIIDYSYSFEDQDFSFEKLAFLVHSNSCDFRNSACPTIANYVFYDNKLLTPEETLYRDKGITLQYEPDSLTSLYFLLEG